MDFVYLDYAATAAVRPPEVLAAVQRYLVDIGATPGRSGHSRALAAGRMALGCRRRLAELLGYGGDPGRITFHLNATHALNVAIFGTMAAGDRAVRTVLDHNAVRRPLAALSRRGASVDVLPLDRLGRPDLEQLRSLIHGDGRPARLLILPHGSNVTGAVLPIAEMADVAHEFGTIVLIDAAQTVGHIPVEVDVLGADLIAFSGHKGLAGPQGTGVLWVREGTEVEPHVFGGTGGDSAPVHMPDAYPDHLEAGTQNGPGIAGLDAAVELLLRVGISDRHRMEHQLKERLLSGLREVNGLRILSSERPDSLGIVTTVAEGVDPGRLAMRLDREHGVQVRAGLHCAPGAHQVLGTLETGALRLSIGWASTDADIDRAVTAMRELLARGDTG